MAILGKNGGLNGAISNLVFVQSGGRTIVRSKPDGVRQTARTKSAASVFGAVSEREKWLRNELLYRTGFPKLQHFAARHRARLRKTIVQDEDSLLHGRASFGRPDALAGFDFNPALPWSGCTNFFPRSITREDGAVDVSLPELQWGVQIKPPKDARSAVLKLVALAVDMNLENPEIRQVSELAVGVSPGGRSPEQALRIPAVEEGRWLLLAAGLNFARSRKAPAECVSGCYLWAYSGNAGA